MKTQIVKTKAYFLGAVSLLALVILGGSFLFRGTSVYSSSNIIRVAQGLKYKMKFSSTNKNYLAAVSAAYDSATEPTSGESTPIKQASLVPVLVYHGIVKHSDRFSMTQETFAGQMAALKNAGYQTITIDQFYDFAVKGTPVPDKSFLLTFDDGRKDSFYGADPVLSALNYNATMFIATGVSLPVDPAKLSTYYLNQEEITQMQKSGRWFIQSHAIQKNGGYVQIDEEGTQGNFLSNKMWISAESRFETNDEYEARIGQEFSTSRRAIEAVLGTKVVALSYPFGDFGQQSVDIPHTYAESVIRKAIQANYQIAFQQVWPVDHEFSQNYAFADPYYLKRVEPSPEWSGTELLTVLDGGKTKIFPYIDTFEKNNGWRKVWGTFSIGHNTFTTGASDATQGSFAVLDGTYPWKNYLYTANLDWKGGSHVVLVARYVDSENYVTCSWSDTSTRIEQRVNGRTVLLAEQKQEYVLPTASLPLSIAVRGTTAICYAGDKEIVRTSNVPHPLDEGGIGVKTWDDGVGIASVALHTIEVNEINSISDIPSHLSPLELAKKPSTKK